MALKDLELGGVTAEVLSYLWIKYPSTVLRVIDLPPIQRCHQPYAAEIWIISVSVISARLVLLLHGINMKLSSSSFQWH